MRWGEECPYITPCGWCSRQGKPCEKRAVENRKRYGIPAAPPDDKLAAALMAAEEKEG